MAIVRLDRPASTDHRSTASPAGARLRLVTLATAAALTSLLALSACAGHDSPEVLLAKAHQSLAANEPRAAEIHLKNLLQENDNAEARFLLAGVHRQSGDLASAEKEYQRALEMGYERDKVLPPLMDVLLRSGKPQKVLDLSQDLKLTDPSAKAEALVTTARALMALGKPEEAGKTFNEALAAFPGSVTAQVGLATLQAAADRPGARTRVESILKDHPDSVEALTLLADLDIADGQRDAARQTLLRVVKRTPDNAEVQAKLVSLALDANDLNDARTHHADLAKIAPGSPITSYLKALIEVRSNNLPGARDAVAEALRRAPDYLPAASLAAGVYLQLGDYEQAERQARSLIERAPDVAQGYRLLGATYLRMNAPDRALQVVAKPIERGAKDAMLFTIAGEAALRQNDPTAAAKYFEQARALDPKDARKIAGLALAHLASGDPKRAIDELEGAVQLDSSNLQTELALVTALMRDKRYDQALEAIARIDKKAPTDPLAANLRGAVLSAQGDTKGARGAFEEALARDPKYFPAAANLANLDLHDNKPADARKRYESILSADPKNAEAQIALAALAARTGAPRAQVLALLEKARNANPQSAVPVLATARYMLETDTPGEAVPLLQEAVNRDQDNAQLLDVLATALLRTDQRTQAIATWEKLLRASPRTWGAQMRIGEAYRAEGDNEAALASFRKAAAIAPDAAEPQLAIAGTLQQLGRKDEAQKVAAALRKSDRNQLVGLLLEGDLAAADNKWAPAIDAYRKAFDQQKSVPIGTKLHRALMAAGRTGDADIMLRDWIRAEPQNLVLRLFAGESGIARQQWRQAYDHYAVVLDKEPGNVLALNNAAWALHQMKDPRAPEVAKRAWEAAPRNPAVLDTYGVILSEGGDPKGLEYLREAVAAAPKATQLRLHLAEALARAGDKTAARNAISVVLEASSTGPIADAARALQAKL